MKQPEMIKATRRLLKEEEKWMPIEIDICRRLQTSMAFFLPSLSEITPAVIRPNIREIWFRLTGNRICDGQSFYVYGMKTVWALLIYRGL